MWSEYNKKCPKFDVLFPSATFSIFINQPLWLCDNIRKKYTRIGSRVKISQYIQPSNLSNALNYTKDRIENFMFQISALHQSNYDNYVSDFGDPMLVLNLHCCLMCQESVTCDAEDISEHLNIAHALSLEDYHDRYIANDRTVSTAKKQNSLCRNWDKHHGKLIINNLTSLIKGHVCLFFSRKKSSHPLIFM